MYDRKKRANSGQAEEGRNMFSGGQLWFIRRPERGCSTIQLVPERSRGKEKKDSDFRTRIRLQLIWPQKKMEASLVTDLQLT